MLHNFLKAIKIIEKTLLLTTNTPLPEPSPPPFKTLPGFDFYVHFRHQKELNMGANQLAKTFYCWCQVVSYFSNKESVVQQKCNLKKR